MQILAMQAFSRTTLSKLRVAVATRTEGDAIIVEDLDRFSSGRDVGGRNLGKD
jgi:hypothetical protein